MNNTDSARSRKAARLGELKAKRIAAAAPPALAPAPAIVEPTAPAATTVEPTIPSIAAASSAPNQAESDISGTAAASTAVLPPTAPDGAEASPSVQPPAEESTSISATVCALCNPPQN